MLPPGPSPASSEAAPPENSSSTPQATPPMTPSSRPAPLLAPVLLPAPRSQQGRAASPEGVGAAAFRVRLDVLLWSLSLLSTYLVLTRLLCHRAQSPSCRGLHTATPGCFELTTEPLPSFLHQLPQSFRATSGLSLPSARSIATSFPDLRVYFSILAASTAAALLAPSWYLRGGRSQLLAAAHLLPKAVAVGQLLLQRGPLDAVQLEWFQMCHLGAQGLLLMTLGKAFFAVRTMFWNMYLSNGAAEDGFEHAGSGRKLIDAAIRGMQHMNVQIMHSALSVRCRHSDTGSSPALCTMDCAFHHRFSNTQVGGHASCWRACMPDRRLILTCAPLLPTP
jgi:hypothetical protein